MRRDLLSWLTWWALLAGLHLLLVDSVVGPELATGAVAAAIGATGAVLVRRQQHVLLRPRARWLRGAWRPLAGMVGDLVPLTRVLVARGLLRRGGSGALVEVPFDATSDDPEEAAYRSLTEALGSLAPNTIVVDVDRERGMLLAHQLRPTYRAASSATPLPR
jgi:multisubunit Na+/H+ antiporter MnhE subunit